MKLEAEGYKKIIDEYDNNANGVLSENRSLKEEVNDVRGSLKQTCEELGILKEQIFAKIETALKYEKLRDEAEARVKDVEFEITSVRESKEEIREQLAKTEKALEQSQAKSLKLTKAAKLIGSLYEELKSGFQPIESTFTCLSCLEYLSAPKPHTLICGHSICRKVSSNTIKSLTNYSTRLTNLFCFSSSA